MASSARALVLSLKPRQPPFSSHHHHNHNHHLSFSPNFPSAAVFSRFRLVGCLFSGGGLSDTRKSEFSREFQVIAAMLKRIEPLDSSDISKGVPQSAKDSMKQTISTMLGLLPSHQFQVSIRVSKLPLHRLLFSSIITGYTLWNAEYRMSLMRNFDLSLESSRVQNFVEGSDTLGLNCEEREVGSEEVCVGENLDISQQNSFHSLKGLSPEAFDYVQQLEAELCSTKKELETEKQEFTQTGSDMSSNNNLLQYLRSLETDMVLELSQPSSAEVKEVIHELVQNTMERFFKDELTSETHRDASIESMSEVFTTTRDYLAKLLFWCMLLGHHLRGLENRVHLSCVVGLL